MSGGGGGGGEFRKAVIISLRGFLNADDFAADFLAAADGHNRIIAYTGSISKTARQPAFCASAPLRLCVKSIPFIPFILFSHAGISYPYGGGLR